MEIFIQVEILTRYNELKKTQLHEKFKSPNSLQKIENLQG